MKIFKLVLNTFPRPYLIKLSYLARPFLSLWLRGDRYTDPIDGKSFKRFLPYGYAVQRPNVLSPSTLSLERHRLIWLYLKNETDFFTKPLKVLHMAPEQCFLSLFRKMKNLDYTTADLYSPIVDIKADILNLPFEDNSFDFVLCNHVLEHIDDDQKAMKELFRVMKKGGTGIFQVPQEIHREKTFEDPSITDPEERAKYFGQYDHVRVYGRDYFDRLRNAGFKVEEIDYSKVLSPEDIDKYRLANGEILPVCSKPL
ncbi:methyltransferase domain-containing protein [Lutimonas saemankumensis]|uniref:class I SAM-dependent methyltransferase n=1 Tax=Lutimonas saemankumensis TaxID=483016 RepID=UPI001CD416E0|nr:class I SAM-dependent methyltransferase [Lutimonas saemankumensis]MCA0933164.1 methyltransferase domain-containing protein [Lutimonas saemankumensis]